MTAQVAEQLIYNDEKYALCECPLNDYFALAGIQSNLSALHTACWRGYVGTWEIIDRRLYLIGLEGMDTDGQDIAVSTFFPDFPDQVFAHWYTGTLRVPQGELLDYVHMGFGSTYERDLLLEVIRGCVVDESVHVNGTAPNPRGRKGYSVGATYVFGTDGDDQVEEQT